VVLQLPRLSRDDQESIHREIVIASWSIQQQFLNA
jgi:hypothetical protein